tara:strand:+ start:37 stop:393 length:357 start_codon:yes stop_codon:yes gene_type:complete
MAETEKVGKANYTTEMVEQAVTMYQDLGNDGLAQIAEAIGKNVRSVRSKLVREGVYVASPKTSAAKREGPTKKELLHQLEAVAPFEVDGFMGATKSAIGDLIAHFDSTVAESDMVTDQ